MFTGLYYIYSVYLYLIDNDTLAWYKTYIQFMSGGYFLPQEKQLYITCSF